MKRKDRVRRHRNPGRDILNAKTFQVDRPAVLLDQYDGARQLSGHDLIVEKFGDTFELVRRRRGDGGRLVGRGRVGPDRQRQGRSDKFSGARSRGALQYLSRWRLHSVCPADRLICGKPDELADD